MAKIPESPSYTKPVGKPGDERVRPAKVDYTKFTKDEPYQGPAKGGYHNVGKAAKVTPSKGDERVRPEKVDYTKFDREEPYQGPSKGGYHNVGKQARSTKGDGSERKYTDKNKSPFRNAK